MPAPSIDEDLQHGAEHYHHGVPLSAIPSPPDFDFVRQGWLDEQARTWSREWPTDPGDYWAWVRWDSDDAWELRVVRASECANGIAHAMSGSFVNYNDIAEALFARMVPPPPAPLPPGALVRKAIS